MTQRRYQPMLPISFGEALELLKSGSHDELLALAPRVGEYLENWREAQDICIRLLENDDPRVRNNAVMGLSYIARVHGKLDKRIVKPYLLREMRCNSQFKEQIKMYIDDINKFLNWNIGKRK